MSLNAMGRQQLAQFGLVCAQKFSPSVQHSIRMKIKLQLGTESKDGNLNRSQRANENDESTQKNKDI